MFPSQDPVGASYYSNLRSPFSSILEPIVATNQTKDLPRTFYVHSSNIWDEAAWSEPIFFETSGSGQDVSIRFALF